jgi:hypothetical protein
MTACSKIEHKGHRPMQLARAKAIIATYGWRHKIDRRPLEQGGVSERLYATKMVHICNVAQLPTLTRDDLVTLLQLDALSKSTQRTREGKGSLSAQEIEQALMAATELAVEHGWKAFQHHVGGQAYFCAQKVHYLCTLERLEAMPEAQFRQLLQMKLPGEKILPAHPGKAELGNRPPEVGSEHRASIVIPSVAAVLAHAFEPQLALPPVPVPPGTVCAQSGVPLTEGIALPNLLSLYSSGLADTFRFVTSIQAPAPDRVSGPEHTHCDSRSRPSGRKSRRGHTPRYVSVEVARVYAERFSGNLLTMDGRELRPLITAAFATEERPRWRDLLLHSLTEGMQTVVIMTNEAQKRLWPRAAVSFVGPNWQVLLNDEQGCRLLRVSFAQVLSCLHVIERVYTLGFSKASIREGLMTYTARSTITAVGVDQVRYYDLALSQIRPTAAFAIALFVAQKEETVHD